MTNIDYYLQLIYLIGIPIVAIFLIIKIPWEDGLELLCCIVGGFTWPAIAGIYSLVWIIYQYKKWSYSHANRDTKTNSSNI